MCAHDIVLLLNFELMVLSAAVRYPINAGSYVHWIRERVVYKNAAR